MAQTPITSSRRKERTGNKRTQKSPILGEGLISSRNTLRAAESSRPHGRTTSAQTAKHEERYRPSRSKASDKQPNIGPRGGEAFFTQLSTKMNATRPSRDGRSPVQLDCGGEPPPKLPRRKATLRGEWKAYLTRQIRLNK